ncbi:hypothetical protein [Salinivibrio socompensis]|nr:hypothetical protein [Salinivibrio socompensis]
MDILQHQVIPTDDDLLANYLDDTLAYHCPNIADNNDVFSDDIEDATR